MRSVILKAATLCMLIVSAVTARCNEQKNPSPVVYKAMNLYNKEQYVKALELFISGMEDAEKNKDSLSYMICSGYIGNIYNSFNDFNGSIYYFLNGYNMSTKGNNKDMEARFLSNIVGTYCKMGNAAKAKEYFEKEKKVKTSEFLNWKYYLLYNHARILQVENKLQEALEMHSKTLDFAKSKGMEDLYGLIQLNEMGNILVKQERYKEAIEYGQKCMQSSMKNKDKDLLINAYRILADAYRGSGDIEKSVKYQNMLFAMSDTVFNAKRFYVARNNLKEYEDRVKGRQITSLNSVILRQSNIILCISVFAALMLTASVIIYMQYRKIRKTQLLLISKTMDNAKLDESNREHLKQYVSTLATEQAIPTDEDNDNSAPMLLDNIQASVLLNKVIAVFEDISVISDPDFSLATLAEKTGSNMKYVSYIINSSYNKNFKTLLNEYRIREACRRLVNNEEYGNMTIQAIYEGLGYHNASSFIRAFKQVMGMTPSVYQKLSRE